MEKKVLFDKQLAQCINDVRQNPTSITDDLKGVVDTFDNKGKTYKFSKTDVAHKAVEPAALWKQTIDFLKKQKKLPTVIFNPELSEIATSFLKTIKDLPEKDIKTNTLEQVVVLVKQKVKGFNENLNSFLIYNGMENPFHQTLSMIVDDGDKKRIRRQAILDKDLQSIGVGAVESKDKKKIVLVLFSTKGKPLVLTSVIKKEIKSKGDVKKSVQAKAPVKKEGVPGKPKTSQPGKPVDKKGVKPGKPLDKNPVKSLKKVDPKKPGSKGPNKKAPAQKAPVKKPLGQNAPVKPQGPVKKAPGQDIKKDNTKVGVTKPIIKSPQAPVPQTKPSPNPVKKQPTPITKPTLVEKK